MKAQQDEQKMIVKNAFPKEFYCPLTGNIMSDPVILYSVQDVNGAIVRYENRYERIAIIRALYDKEPKLCPLTGQPITGNLNELPLDAQLRDSIEESHRKLEFKKFDPLAYILVLEGGNIGNTLLFFCQNERRYADQFVTEYKEKIIQIIYEQDQAGSNLLARVLTTGYSSSIFLDSLPPKQAATVILATNQDGWNALMVSCQYAPSAIEALLRSLGNQAAEAILATTHDGWNALMVSCLYAPAAVEVLLQPLGNQAAAAILATNQDGRNALIVSCRNSPAAVETLLRTLGNQAAAAILATTKTGSNALSVACRSTPAVIEPLLRCLDDQAAAAILDTSEDGWNALRIACRYSPTAVAPLLACLTVDQAATAILDRSKIGTNALMFACQFAPATVELLLQRLGDQSTSAILAKDEDGWNALMLACSDAPAAVKA